MRQVQLRKRNLLHELCVVRVQGQTAAVTDKKKTESRKKSNGRLFYLMQTFNCGQAADARSDIVGWMQTYTSVKVRDCCSSGVSLSVSHINAIRGTRRSAMTVINFDTFERARACRETASMVSIQEASEITGYSVSTLRRWQAEGVIMPPRTKHGRQFKYKKADIEALKQDIDEWVAETMRKIMLARIARGLDHPGGDDLQGVKLQPPHI
jgi:excisionase family DNA binding protein